MPEPKHGKQDRRATLTVAIIVSIVTVASIAVMALTNQIGGL